MRRILITAFALGAILLLAPAAHADCIAQTEAEATQRADVIFEGVVLPGRTLPGTPNLESPYRFRVERYLQGSGPSEVTVASGIRSDGVFHYSPSSQSGGTIATSVDFSVQAGQRIVVFATSEPEGFLSSNACSGSHLVGEPGAFAGSEVATPTPIGSWGGWALGGSLGLAAVMAIGYLTARKLIPTA